MGRCIHKAVFSHTQESCYFRGVHGEGGGLGPMSSEASRMSSNANQGKGKVTFRVGVGDHGVHTGWVSGGVMGDRDRRWW